MGTRSAICYRKPYGSIVGVYCHYDGYPEHIQLPILKEKYNTLAKAKALIKGGFISSLETHHDWLSTIHGILNRCTTPIKRGEDLKTTSQSSTNASRSLNRFTTSGSHFRMTDCEYLYVYIPKRGWKYSDIRVPYPKGSDGEPLFTLS